MPTWSGMHCCEVSPLLEPSSNAEVTSGSTSLVRPKLAQTSDEAITSQNPKHDLRYKGSDAVFDVDELSMPPR
jgi:hypothetical protein